MRMGNGQGPWLGEVRLAGTRLAQAEAVICEKTSERGQVCSDGTYHTPGCSMAPGAPVVQAPGGFPTIPVVAGAALVAAGAYLLSGRRSLGASLEVEYPEVFSHIQGYADTITAERAQDAADFKAMTDAGAQRLVALDQQGKAQQELDRQNKIWGSNHMNADALAAAQAAYDAAAAEVNSAGQTQQEYRDKVTQHAQTIEAYRTQVQQLIQQLPAEFQDQAWALVDPCHPVKVGSAQMGWGMRPLAVPGRRGGFFA